MRPAVKAIIVVVFTSTLIRCVCGANHTVGGASGWDMSSNMQDWSSTTTFNVGDDLVFSYTPLYDVVEVNKQGYDTCTIANAIAIDNTGETVIHLTDNRTRYFVCGRMRHCKRGLKLKVQIQAQSNNNNNGTNNNQNQPGNGGQKPSPPPRNLPPRNAPPPSHHSPPSPPPDVPAEKPSSAEPLITPVIILAFAWLSWYFTVNHLMVYAFFFLITLLVYT